MSAILRQLEMACSLLAASASLAAGIDVDVYAGQSNAEMLTPRVTCTCQSASPDFPESCVYHVRTEIHVFESAADSNVSSSLADTIFAVFENSNTATNLTNQVSNLQVYDVLSGEPRNDEGGDAWEQTVTYDIVCTLT